MVASNFLSADHTSLVVQSVRHARAPISSVLCKNCGRVGRCSYAQPTRPVEYNKVVTQLIRNLLQTKKNQFWQSHYKLVDGIITSLNYNNIYINSVMTNFFGLLQKSNLTLDVCQGSFQKLFIQFGVGNTIRCGQNIANLVILISYHSSIAIPCSGMPSLHPQPSSSDRVPQISTYCGGVPQVGRYGYRASVCPHSSHKHHTDQRCVKFKIGLPFPVQVIVRQVEEGKAYVATLAYSHALGSAVCEWQHVDKKQGWEMHLLKQLRKLVLVS